MKGYSGTMDNEKGESSGGDNAGANDGTRKKLSQDGAEALKKCLGKTKGTITNANPKLMLWDLLLLQENDPCYL